MNQIAQNQERMEEEQRLADWLAQQPLYGGMPLTAEQRRQLQGRTRPMPPGFYDTPGAPATTGRPAFTTEAAEHVLPTPDESPGFLADLQRRWDTLLKALIPPDILMQLRPDLVPETSVPLRDMLEGRIPTLSIRLSIDEVIDNALGRTLRQVTNNATTVTNNNGSQFSVGTVNVTANNPTELAAQLEAQLTKNVLRNIVAVAGA